MAEGAAIVKADIPGETIPGKAVSESANILGLLKQ
jgi:hypothetical protein